MAIITLTTDLGHKDFYQSALKGAILSQLPNANIIDVSHQISSYNIPQAAFILKNSYKFFPKGTVHLIGIDANYGSNPRYLAMASDGHYFVGPDNGIFSLLFEHPPTKIVAINIKAEAKFLHFPLLDIFVKAACHLANGGVLTGLGAETTDYNHRSLIQPVVEQNIIRGSVIYIDSFQNVITNITKELFESARMKRRFEVYFRRNESINKINIHYNEVPEGEKLCIFSISNFLEIAINKGNAAGLLGLHVGDIIRIEFYDK
ncbi:SAM hydrolase/SAM-dependent halogenase family protein [Solitalea koreensis]|uniref:S-adenosyl-l-methionine hydroxide adenosyltransferase n=1 Tax=Solitalea koreensis TaxID=543615 RepID=A0A521BB53_9SPHI|nr:SAM-dependent chlorinase/fluorinase [Solitalea koreensis]SMO44315.1 hypothetical protein SAMN06265350_10253 [Solitalea koreensis]